MAKQKKEVTDFSDVVVTLKPLFGIKPEHYLPVIYLIAIILIVFFVLFFPGLSKHGTYITFKTTPEKAPVYVDTAYVGSTPCTAFIKSGNREILIKKPFYPEIVLQKQVKGKVFASLFFPRKEIVFQQCKLDDLEGLLDWSVKDAARFGMLNDFTATYQFPPLFTNAVSAIYGTEGDISKDIYDFLHNVMYYVDSEQELWELISGFSLLVSDKKGFSAFTIIDMAKEIIKLKKMYDGFPCWLTRSLSKAKHTFKTPDKGVQQVSLYDLFVSGNWFTGYFTAYKEKILTINKQETINLEEKKKISVKNTVFIFIPGTTYIMGDTVNLDSSFYPDMETLPHPVTTESFYISEREVTNRDFLSFVKANPSWLPANREKLIADELVTGNYLSHWNGDSPVDEDMEKPVTDISYFAAREYCRWLTSFLSGQFPGRLSARLPYETEWECIAKYIDNRVTASLFFSERGSGSLSNTGKNANDRYPVRDIFGSVWEWCDNWYYPVDSALSPIDTAFTGSEKVVRGGSWATSKTDNVRSWTRGSQPPSWCTPYLGFRPVLSEY
ncbi:MAG: SUMF1/EgtB/PvdO family nonheme iron enzyme [Spirochaetales bacterium]|nr:SUMF1/EgtB/PvdO family nonheme iron enzyme [Spirochaetales bacterium]